MQMLLIATVTLYAPSLAVEVTTGLSHWVSILTLGAVCTFYCAIGGLKAVLWTDLLQAFVMFASLIAVIFKSSWDIGFQNILNRAEVGERLVFFEFSTDYTKRYTFWNSVIGGFVGTLALWGNNQAQIQRLMSVKPLKKSQRVLLFGLLSSAVFHLLCVIAGVVIYALHHSCDPLMNSEVTFVTRPDQLLPYSLLHLFHTVPGLSGTLVAGIFSASLSTISSMLNSSANIVMEDYLRPYCFCGKWSEMRQLLLLRILVVAFGCLVIVLTVIMENFVGATEAVGSLNGILTGPICATFLLGMFTRTANEKGTLFGLFCGMALVASLIVSSKIYGEKPLTLPRSTEECGNSTIIEILNTSNITSTAISIITNTAVSNIANTTKLMNDTVSNNYKYVSSIHQISFMWYFPIGLFIVVISGYLSSVAFGYFTDVKCIDKFLVSPLVRGFLFKNSKDTRSAYTLVPQKKVILDENADQHEGILNFSKTSTDKETVL